jgi:hypothetical protein
MNRRAGLVSPVASASKREGGLGRRAATNRFTAGFKYVGPANPDAARRLGVI